MTHASIAEEPALAGAVPAAWRSAEVSVRLSAARAAAAACAAPAADDAAPAADGAASATLQLAVARLAGDEQDEEVASALVQAAAAAAGAMARAGDAAHVAASGALLGDAGAKVVLALAHTAPSAAAAWLELLAQHTAPPLPAGADAGAVWGALCGAAGLRAKRWRVRAAAAQLAAALARCGTSAVPPWAVSEALLLRLAVEDTQREVRTAAATAGAALLVDGLHGAADDTALLTLLFAVLAAAADEDEAVLSAARAALHAPGMPAVAEPLTRALEEAAADGASAAPPLVLLRAAGTALRLGALPLRDQPQADRLFYSAALLRDAARGDPDVAAAAAACLASAAGASCGALLTWYAAACTSPPAGAACSPHALLSAALTALAGAPELAPEGAAGTSEALRAVHATLAGLRPPRGVYAQVTVDANAAAAFGAAAALRLELLPRLLALLPRAQLFPTALRLHADTGWPPGGEGAEDGGAHPGAATAVAAASFAGGGTLDAHAPPAEGLPPWSTPAAAAAADAALHWLLHAVRDTLRWRDLDTLLAASLAARAPSLRPALLVADLGAPYFPDAPTAFEAEVAAHAVHSVLCRLGHPAATDALPAAFPCLLLALEHTAAPPRLHAQQTARHLATAATRTSLRLRGAVLWPVLMAGLLGCDDRAWPPAVAAACACAHALGGEDASAPQYHELLATLLTELSRRPGDAGRARPLLRAAAPLVRAMRLELLRHTRRLMPILCEWACGADEELRMLAAEALTAAMERIWPRAPHHAPSLWPAMLQGYALSARSPYAVATHAALERLAEQLHHAGGNAFAQAWQASERQAGLAAAPEVAPLMARLRQLRLEHPPVEQVTEATADEAPAVAAVRPLSPPASVPPPPPSSPPPPPVESGAGVEAATSIQQMLAAAALDEQEVLSDGASWSGEHDLAALLADDASVTAALDAWAAGDADALRVGSSRAQDGSGALAEPDDDDGLRAWLDELALEARAAGATS